MCQLVAWRQSGRAALGADQLGGAVSDAETRLTRAVADVDRHELDFLQLLAQAGSAIGGMFRIHRLEAAGGQRPEQGDSRAPRGDAGVKPRQSRSFAEPR